MSATSSVRAHCLRRLSAPASQPPSVCQELELKSGISRRFTRQLRLFGGKREVIQGRPLAEVPKWNQALNERANTGSETNNNVQLPLKLT